MSLLEYKVGTVLTFKTEPYFPWEKISRSRFGVIKIISHDKKNLFSLVSVLQNGSYVVSNIEAAQRLNVMDVPEFAGISRGGLYINVSKPIDPKPLHFTYIGDTDINYRERQLSTNLFIPVDKLGLRVELAWRLTNDYDNFMRHFVEFQKNNVKEAATYTCNDPVDHIKSLPKPDFIEKWQRRTKWIPEDFTLFTKDSLQKMLDRLSTPHSELSKDNIIEIFQSFIEDVNQRNGMYVSPPIETLERDELCEFLEKVASGIGYPDIADLVDDWRDW